MQRKFNFEPSNEQAAMAKITGTVKWSDDIKGFGFISLGDDSKDVFVHHTEIQGRVFKSLAEGQRVEFETQSTPKGMAAENARGLS